MPVRGWPWTGTNRLGAAMRWYRRFGFAQDEALPDGVFVRAGASKPFHASQIDGLFDGVSFHLADHDEVGQALLDGPSGRVGPPVERGFGKAGCQRLGFGCNPFKLLMILLELGMHQSELYSNRRSETHSAGGGGTMGIRLRRIWLSRC